MTDRPEDETEDDRRVRALLAELGSGPDGDALPPAVAARLDDTLAQLVAARREASSDDPAPGEQRDPGATPGGGATVLPLRRRWSRRLTAAAAAVIVVGTGGVALTNLQDPGGAETATSQDSTAGGSAVEDEAGAGQESDTGGTVPEVSTDAFASDVTALLQQRTLLSSPGQLRVPSDARSPGPACPGPRTTDGAVGNGVRLDGRPAVLLVHPKRAGRQLVEAWSCTGDRRLARAVLTPR